MSSTNFSCAKVAVKGYPDLLTYGITDKTTDIAIGYEVEVELRGRTERGWVISLETESDIDQKNDTQKELKKNTAQLSLIQDSEIVNVTILKPILSAHSAFTLKDLEFYNWIAEYYGSNISEVLENAVPQKSGTRKTAAKKNNKEIEEVSDIPLPIEPTLNQQQRNAFEEITKAAKNKTFIPFLLYGITGSGKTEVYLNSIKEIIKNGNSALLIVPEIALTPQILQIFQARLGSEVGVLHSKISQGERWATWNAAKEGKLKIIIGARSAIFCPLPNLSLIVVDEEHENSYKQSDGLRYNSRDLAIMRAKFNNCPVVLGSATPSFESLLHGSKGNYKVLKLTERATKVELPKIEIVDMTKHRRVSLASSNISPELYQSIKETLDKKEQIIIFYNKRGFASFLQCETCGRTCSCPNCSVTLTYYQHNKTLSCHYCGLVKKADDVCQVCTDETQTVIESKKKVAKLVARGSGTEKVHDELQVLFPNARIIRMDRESTTYKDSIETILDEMKSHKADILVGTQMIAKGHDIPNVTLVGFIDSDVGLHFPDFRASERTYQLIVQAAGRAGRGLIPGKVILQTNEPNHPTIIAAVKNSFQAFARYELEYRKILSYPPHGRLGRLIVSSPSNMKAEKYIKEAIEFINSQNIKTESTESTGTIKFKVLGPTKAPIEKLRGRYRWHALIKTESAKELSRLAKEIHTSAWKIKGSEDIRMVLDIDPVEML